MKKKKSNVISINRKGVIYEISLQLAVDIMETLNAGSDVVDRLRDGVIMKSLCDGKVIPPNERDAGLIKLLYENHGIFVYHVIQSVLSESGEIKDAVERVNYLYIDKSIPDIIEDASIYDRAATYDCESGIYELIEDILASAELGIVQACISNYGVFPGNIDDIVVNAKNGGLIRLR